MRPVRLFVLGALATHGPMYGYQIRQQAIRDRTEMWTAVKPGSLYSALHRMAAEGLLDVLDPGADGPDGRTVYRITPSGTAAFDQERNAALRRVVIATDPVDLALRYVHHLSVTDLAELARARRAELEQRLAVHERAHLDSQRYLDPLESLTFDHVLERLRGEVAWHEKLLAHLDAQAQTRPPARKEDSCELSS